MMNVQTLDYVNFDYLNEMIDNDEQLKFIVLTTLLEEVPEELNKLKSALIQKNWIEFHEISHKLKSSLAYIGNKEIFESNQNMMEASRQTVDLEKIPVWLEEVSILWDKIETEIQYVVENL